MYLEVTSDIMKLAIVVSSEAKLACISTCIDPISIDVGLYPNVTLNGDPLLEQRVAALEANKYVDTINLNW